MRYCSPYLFASLLLASASTFGADNNHQKWQYDASIYGIYDGHDYGGSLFDKEDFEDGTYGYLRRIKASAAVEYNDIFSIEAAVEYKEPDKKISLDELTFNYKLTQYLELTLGKFKEPLGLENQLSLKYQPLLERSTPTQAFLFGRNTGIAADVEFDQWTLDLAVTKLTAESEQFDDSYAKSLRLTYAPLQKKKKFIHFGLDYSTRDGIENKYDINETLIAVGLGNLIHSPNFAARSITLTGAEFAARYKQLLLQSEYFEQTIQRDNIADQSMQGYYAMLVYTLHGNSRDYKHGKLVFKNKNKHTLELASRYSKTDLSPVFEGDEAEVNSVALNYFYKKHLRLSVEYENADVISNTRKKSTMLSGKSLNSRVQLAF